MTTLKAKNQVNTKNHERVYQLFLLSFVFIFTLGSGLNLSLAKEKKKRTATKSNTAASGTSSSPATPSTLETESSSRTTGLESPTNNNALPYDSNTNSPQDDILQSSPMLHQAAEGRAEVTTGYTYSSAKLSSSKTTVTDLGSGLTTSYNNVFQVKDVYRNYQIPLMVELGLNPQASVGFSTSYLNERYKTDDSSELNFKGISDPILFFNSRYNIGNIGELRVGAQLKFPITFSTKKDLTDHNNVTNSRYVLTPSLGYDARLTPILRVGAQLTYDIFATEFSYKNSDTHFKGGNILLTRGFLEAAPISNFLLGMQVFYSRQSYLKDNLGITKQKTTSFGFGVYSAYQITPQLALLPTINYTQIVKTGSATFSIFETTEVTLENKLNQLDYGLQLRLTL